MSRSSSSFATGLPPNKKPSPATECSDDDLWLGLCFHRLLRAAVLAAVVVYCGVPMRPSSSRSLNINVSQERASASEVRRSLASR